MTKDEALKLALEALENISTALREEDVLGSDSELMLNAITAIEEALDECDEDELIIRYHEMTIKRLEKRIEELTVQPEQEPVARVIDNGTPEGATEWIPFANRVEPLETGDLLYTHAKERNFCQRCGKRTADSATIHTCTGEHMTEEDEEFQRIEREAKMRRMAEEDDDTQVYKKPWVGLTYEEYQEVLIEHDGGGLILFYHLIEAKLREKNST